MNVGRLRRSVLTPLLFGSAVAAFLVWATGFFYAEIKVWQRPLGEVWTVGTSGRCLCIRHAEYWPSNRWYQAGWLGTGMRWEPEWLPGARQLSEERIYIVPWSNVAVVGVVLVVVLSAMHNRVFCRNCGYDLRGLPGRVCPECGRGFVKKDTVG